MEKEDYIQARLKAKEFYKKIGRVMCPALGEYISFNNVGFNHIMRKDGVMRSMTEQVRRFELLPYVEDIIKDPRAKKANIEYREEPMKVLVNRKGVMVLQESVAYFWTFNKTVNGWDIQVVTRKLNKGNKHFFSVIGDESK